MDAKERTPGQMSTNDDSQTGAILDQIPSALRPDGPDIDTYAIRSRLDHLDRQELVLVLARWLYEHREDMDKIAFEMLVEDVRVNIDNDEVVVSDEVDSISSSSLVEDVVSLQQSLDAMVDQGNETFLGKTLEAINKVGWDMPAAWHVLEKHAPVLEPLTSTQWLDEHRAAWEAQQLQQDTSAAQPAAPTPRTRM